MTVDCKANHTRATPKPFMDGELAQPKGPDAGQPVAGEAERAAIRRRGKEPGRCRHHLQAGLLERAGRTEEAWASK